MIEDYGKKKHTSNFPPELMAQAESTNVRFSQDADQVDTPSAPRAERFAVSSAEDIQFPPGFLI